MFDFFVLKELELTKGNILKKISEYDVFRYYIGDFKLNKAISAPHRKDKTPSFSIYQGRCDLLFKDHATGESGNFIKLVQIIFSCDYEEALSKINEDFNLQLVPIKFGLYQGKSRLKEKNISTIEESKKFRIVEKNFTKEELAYWANHGINKEWLDFFNIKSCKFVYFGKDVIMQSSYKDFVFSYAFMQNQEIRHKIYCPKATVKKYRFLGNTDSHTIQGYEQMLIYKNTKPNKVLIISKSLKDVVFLSILGYCAVALNSESVSILPEVAEKLQGFEYTFLWYDDDEAGRTNSKRLLEENPWIDGEIFTGQANAKDPTDFFKLYGLEETKKMIKQKIEDATKKLKNN